MRIAVYPGSFDPVTNGHLNIIERAAKLFDRLIVCVMVNAEKRALFSLEEREAFLHSVCAHLPNVEIDSFGGLLAAYAKEHGCCTIIKGLRAGSDFEKEFQMAMINRKLNPELESLFLTAEHQYMYLSSSAVKELASYGADVSELLPPQILQQFQQRIRNNSDNKENEK
ncbi:MAG: pantetheine-phosphate adenylyltransferase [Oscillospiraceae bacterium]|nr:pantetheine-phosphate adenylyltransferase [Oscillospiraceae bacterium]